MAERDKLVSRTSVVKAAAVEAQRLVDEAQAESDRMRLEVDDYVDAASFELRDHPAQDPAARSSTAATRSAGATTSLEALSESTEDVEPLPRLGRVPVLR